MRRYLGGLLLLTLPLSSLQAWNFTGHRIIAAIAYDRLTPAAKAQVDALLKQHPDFAMMPSRDAFLAASAWPDTIRNDPRFYDDTAKEPKPTPLLPGFASAGFINMARHTNWHYIDIPFSPDGTPLEPTRVPNALTELRRILRERSLTAYDLPWLEHLTGDVHQPLHCVSRFTQSLPHGDQGGNLVFITPGRNLHSLWDGLAGADTSTSNVDAQAKEIMAEWDQANGPHAHLSNDPKRWVQEGSELAKRQVYTFGTANGSQDHPIALPDGYDAKARAIARVQLAKAGIRLAAVLNARAAR